MLVRRLGNNVFIKWKIKTKQDLSNMNLAVFVKSPMSDIFQVNYSVENDTIITALLGKDQQYIGIYSFILVKDYGTSNQEVLDAIDAVKLISQDPDNSEVTEVFSGDCKGQKGDKGDPGVNGKDGKSAYDIYVTLGGTLSEEEWIKSLKGKDGLSAYEIAVSLGYNGSKEQWLASLHGSDGFNGKSAYELAVSNGFTGTQSQWLDSLKGKDGINGTNGKDGFNGADGQPGLSAYQLALAAGFTGTLFQWLDSLKGKDGINGTNGLSAYDIAVSLGFTGTQSQWLDSLKGKDGNIQEIDNVVSSISLQEIDNVVSSISQDPVQSSAIYSYVDQIKNLIQNKYDPLINSLSYDVSIISDGKAGIDEVNSIYSEVENLKEQLKVLSNSLNSVESSSNSGIENLKEKIDDLTEKVKGFITEGTFKEKTEILENEISSKASANDVQNIVGVLSEVVGGVVGTPLEDIYALIENKKFNSILSIEEQVEAIKQLQEEKGISVETEVNESDNPVASLAVKRALDNLSLQFSKVIEGESAIYGCFGLHYGFKLCDAAKFIVFATKDLSEVNLDGIILGSSEIESESSGNLNALVLKPSPQYYSRLFSVSSLYMGEKKKSILELGRCFNNFVVNNEEIESIATSCRDGQKINHIVDLKDGNEIKILCSGSNIDPGSLQLLGDSVAQVELVKNGTEKTEYGEFDRWITPKLYPNRAGLYYNKVNVIW